MRAKTKAALNSIHSDRPYKNIWQWNAENTDFSLVPSYDTPLKGPYDPDFINLLKEPVEALDDPEISEIWIRKPSRAGASENVIINPIRNRVAVNPRHMMYLSADQEGTERFFDKRIKDGLKCTPLAAEKLQGARTLENRIHFSDMDLVAYWPSNKGAFKQAGYQEIYVDEASLLPNTAPGMIRKRTDTYVNSKIVFLSSPDPVQKRPSSKDPIFYEMEDTDQRKFFMPDPKTGKDFCFEMGSEKKGFGLMWDKKAKRKDGSWDYEKVRASAYYKTPYGSKIKNKDRLKIVSKGKWKPTNPDAPKWKRGYIFNAFYVPFKAGDFGNIACAFLEAKKEGPEQLKVFVYEYLAEKWKEQSRNTIDDVLLQRCKDYARGSLFSECNQEPTEGITYKNIYLPKTKVILGSIDVQKDHQWYLFREWIEGGDSGLVDYGYAHTWAEIEQKANYFKAERMCVDYGYEERRIEVFEYAQEFAAYPLRGVDNLFLPYSEKKYNVKEGKRGGTSKDIQNKIIAYEFNTNIFRTLLINMMQGISRQTWSLFDEPDEEYIKQANSTYKENGIWVTKPGRSQDHLWDCEVMNLVLATIYGFYSHDWLLVEN